MDKELIARQIENLSDVHMAELSMIGNLDRARCLRDEFVKYVRENEHQYDCWQQAWSAFYCSEKYTNVMNMCFE